MSRWIKISVKNWPTGEVVTSRTGDVCPDTAKWVKKSLHFTPDPVQTEILSSTAKRLHLLCSRQWGKSTVVAAKALHHALTVPGAFIIIGSSSQRQSNELLTKFKAFAALVLPKRLRKDTETGSYYLPNGARIVALPESPDKVRGFSAPSLIILDEAAFVREELYEALTPSLATSKGALWLLSSAGEQRGFFHRIWTARPAGWSFFRATAEDCPRIDPAFLAAERAEKGEAYVRREYFCEFAGGRNQFIDDASIDALTDIDYELLEVRY